MILTQQEHDEGGDDGDDDTGADVVVLVAHGAGEHIQRGGHHLILGLILQVQVCHVVFVVGGHTLQDGAGDDGGLEQGQQDLEEHTKVGAAIQNGAFVQRGGKVLEELQEDIDGDNVRAHHQDDVAGHGVHQMQSRHDLVHRDLRGDAGDQGGDGEQVADQLVAGKLEPVQHISQHGTDHNAARQHADQDDKAVQERLAHVGLVPCCDEVIEVEPALGRGDNVGVGVLFLTFEGGEDAGYDGHQCHKGSEDEQRIFANVDQNTFGLDRSGFVHTFCLTFTWLRRCCGFPAIFPQPSGRR